MHPSSIRLRTWKRLLGIAIFIACSTSLTVVLQNAMKSAEPLTSDQRRSCDSIFHQEAYSSGNLLHPRQCSLKNYRSEELVQCLNHLASAAKSVKRRDYFHIAFTGDSRVRQMYHSFSGMLPLYDANITGHVHTRGIVLQQDALVTSHVLQLKVTFLWRPYCDEDMEQTITDWTRAGVQDAPDILIVGNLLWSMGREYRREYPTRVQNLSRLLDALTSTTRVIWWDQDQLNEAKYHHVAEKVAKADVNNKRIQELNLAARRAFQNTQVIVWDSTHLLLSEYHRACTGFPQRQDPWRHWRCPDPTHASFLYAHKYNQRLLNYLCNPFMKLGEDFCCNSNQDAIFRAVR